MARLKTSFPKSIPALIALARHVKTCMSSNANFMLITEAFAAALAKLAEDIEKLQKAQDDAAFGGTQKTSYRDQAAAELVATLRNVIRHVELFANGNVSILRSSGYELVDPLEKKWKIPVDLPQLLVSVAPGQESGTLVAKAQSIPYALSYLISANLPLGVTTALVGCQSGQRQQRGGEA
ncbi:hypothetical protein GMSM_45770 [Geomonas sp. Red276]